MADDETKSGGQDRTCISLSEDYEVRDWSKQFAVTPDELRAAVKAVGNEAAAVEAHLKGRKRDGVRIGAGTSTASASGSTC